MCPAQPVSRFHISVTFVTSRPTSQFVSPGQLSVGGPLLRCTELHSAHFISNNKDYFVPKYFQHYSNNVSIGLRTLRGIYTQRSEGDQWILNTGHVTSRAGSEVSKVFTITEKASTRATSAFTFENLVHCLYLSAKYPIFNQHQLPSRRAQAH